MQLTGKKDVHELGLCDLQCNPSNTSNGRKSTFTYFVS